MRIALVRIVALVFVAGLAGCVGEVAIDAAVTVTPAGGLPSEYEIELDLRPADLASGDSEAQGLIAAPTEVAVFVGEELLVELTLVDPSLGEVLPSSMPADAVFEVADAEHSARVRWMPGLTDVGQHEFIFLVVDAVDESMVLGTSVLVVSVMPRHRFIEYGF